MKKNISKINLLITTIFTIAILIFFFYNNEKKPPIKRKILKEILIDLNLAEGISTTQKQPNQSSLQYKYILHKYNITQAELDSTMTYYINRPKKLNKIYEEVLTYFNNMEAKLKGTKKENYYLKEHLTEKPLYEIYKDLSTHSILTRDTTKYYIAIEEISQENE